MRSIDDDPSLADLLNDSQLARLNQLVSALCRTPVCLGAEASPEARPVEFNLHTVAWLSGGGSPAEQAAAAELVAFLMTFIGKYRLAASLHHDATEASHAELQRQNAALKVSEARYRELSDQLQQKVDEQVAVIRQTQQGLYESSRLRAVGQLAAGVAHEINNPIGFITSNLRVARDYLRDLGQQLPPGQGNEDLLTDFDDLIAESVDGANRIAAIVSDLKTFSSIDQSEYSQCDVNQLLRSAVHLLQAHHGKQLEVMERFDTLPEIPGHPARLSQTFYNLLDNAAQALEGNEKGRILVKTSISEGSVQVLIQDNGCGIPEPDRSQVFDAFFTTRPVGSGTGLGLTVARDTLHAHQGTIHIDSREKVGTRVTLTLPTG